MKRSKNGCSEKISALSPFELAVRCMLGGSAPAVRGVAEI